MSEFPKPCFSDDIYLYETKEWGISLISQFLASSDSNTISQLKLDECFHSLQDSQPDDLENTIERIIDDYSEYPQQLSNETNQIRIQFLYLLIKVKHALHPIPQMGEFVVQRYNKECFTPQKYPSKFIKPLKVNTKTSKSPDSKKNFVSEKFKIDSPTKDDTYLCRICECSISSSQFPTHIQECLNCHSMKIEWQDLNQSILTQVLESRKSSTDEIIKVVDDSLFTSSLSLFFSKQLISKIDKGEIQNIDAEVVDMLKRRHELMTNGSKMAKQAVNSILSEDSPNLNDGYSMPPLPFPRLSDFDIISPISRGAFGSVYLCRRKQTCDIFALKSISADNYATKNEVLSTEREVMCRASNPAVVSLYWSFRASGTIFFVMSFARGGDLYSLLDTIGSLEEETAIFYIAEIIEAVEYLHSLGIVHCDLKPDNILISNKGHLQLTDFGLSKFGAEKREFNSSLLFRFSEQSFPFTHPIKHASPISKKAKNANENDMSQTEPVPNLRKSGLIGTPHYIAPESLLKSDYSPKVDWWAVGIIAYELVVGQPPFIGDTESQVFASIIEGELEWPDDVEVSEDYKKFVSDLLQHNPERRPNVETMKSYAIFKDIDFDNLFNEEAPFLPELQSTTDLSYFENVRNSADNFDLACFDELKNAARSREKPDEWCCTNIAALAEKNREILSLGRNELP